MLRNNKLGPPINSINYYHVQKNKNQQKKKCSNVTGSRESRDSRASRESNSVEVLSAPSSPSEQQENQSNSQIGRNPLRSSKCMHYIHSHSHNQLNKPQKKNKLKFLKFNLIFFSANPK